MPDIADLPWPRLTERLTVRPYVPEDLEAVWQVRRKPEVNAWMTHAAPDLDGFAERVTEPRWQAVTLVVERDGAIIGDLMLAVEDAWSQGEVAEQAKEVQAEIGWCFDPAAQGHGYATEAVRELVRIAFEDLGLRRLTALCFVANEPSWRLMERLGMRREGHYVEESLHRDGVWMDSYAYALLASEWDRPSTVGV